MPSLPLRKLRVSDAEWEAWKTAAPDGNISAWLRALANAALAENDRPSEGDPTPVLGGPKKSVIHVPPRRDPEFLHKEAGLLTSITPREA